MKNSILSIAVVALSFLQVQATENKTMLDSTISAENVSAQKIVQVYDWNVTTTKNSYSGTSLDIEHANRMIALVSSGEIILDKKVESYYMMQNEATDNNNRLYFWEVTSSKGYAKGFSSTEYDANHMIKLVASGDIISSKIIISGIIK
ncbi:hypothetical protein [Bizionia myxarmorum]|uniref:Uncharacterized protein n=1 Tax=Bizionia myxarmorum TaxID=291186 RepID=A0A5D0RCE7_9FLAO|nr:hypothetical protein [Bizionia myxarmorum]TYB78465.1 hypothetical protein ES674_01400 [Bizionia myxarmorum]